MTEEQYRQKLIKAEMTLSPYLIREESKEPVSTIQFRVEPQRKKERKPYTLTSREYPSHWSKSMRNKYQSYYFRAKKHGRDMSLTFNEFEYLLSQSCVYCGKQSNITIDRIDSSLGYQTDNCQPCCSTCNTMKWNMSSEDFIEQCKRIASKCIYT